MTVWAPRGEGNRRSRPIGARRAFGRLFLYIAGVLVLVALGHGISTVAFLQSAQAAEGTVIRYEEVRNTAPFVREGGVLYYPVVRYRTLNAERVEFVARRGAHQRPFKIDQEVTVLYQPDSPGRQRIDDALDLWGGSLVFLVVAVVCVLVGLAVPYSFATGRLPYDDHN